MNSVTINKNSLRYRLATQYSTMSKTAYSEDTCWDQPCPISICEFNSYVIKGLFGAGFIVIITSLLGVIMLSPFFYGILCFLYGFADMPVFVPMGIGAYSVILLAILGWFIKNLAEQIFRKRYVDFSETYIGHTYKSIKDKICVPVKFQ